MRFLLVDDYPMMRDGLRLAIQKAFPEAQVRESGDGADALMQVEKFRPHMVVLDLNLRDMNGLEVARRIRSMRHSPKILVLATEIDPWTVAQTLEAGVAGYLSKTNAATQLQEAIQTIRRGEVFLCQNAATTVQQGQRQIAAIPPNPMVLSDREREILKQMTQGETTKAIAFRLQISPKTVETHRIHIMRKLRINNIASLTHYAIQHGLIQIIFRPFHVRESSANSGALSGIS